MHWTVCVCFYILMKGVSELECVPYILRMNLIWCSWLITVDEMVDWDCVVEISGLHPRKSILILFVIKYLLQHIEKNNNTQSTKHKPWVQASIQLRDSVPSPLEEQEGLTKLLGLKRSFNTQRNKRTTPFRGKKQKAHIKGVHTFFLCLTPVSCSLAAKWSDYNHWFSLGR